MKRLLAALVVMLVAFVAAPAAAQAYWHVNPAYYEAEVNSYGSADATFRAYGKRASRWSAAQVGYVRRSDSRVKATIQWASTDGTMTVLADVDTSGSSTWNGSYYSWNSSAVTVHSIGLRNLCYC